MPCVKEVKRGRYEAQDSIVLSMSNGLLYPELKHDTHTLLFVVKISGEIASFKISRKIRFNFKKWISS